MLSFAGVTVTVPSAFSVTTYFSDGTLTFPFITTTDTEPLEFLAAVISQSARSFLSIPQLTEDVVPVYPLIPSTLTVYFFVVVGSV